MKIKKIKDIKNALTRIKEFSNKYVKIINEILISMNKAYEFFNGKYSFFAKRVFVHFDNNMFIKVFNA